MYVTLISSASERNCGGCTVPSLGYCKRP